MINDYIAYWPLNETNPANALDKSNYGNNGIGTGTNSAQGGNGVGRLFTASNSDKIVVLHNSSQNFTTAISITAWIKLTTADQSRTIVNKGFDHGGSDVAYNYNLEETAVSGLKLRFFYYDSFGFRQANQTDNDILSTSVFKHIAFTFTFGTTASAIWYVNGATTASTWTFNDGTPAPTTPTDNLRMGCADLGGESNFFDGTLSDLRIYNRVLSASEVVQVMDFKHVSYFGSRIASQTIN